MLNGTARLWRFASWIDISCHRGSTKPECEDYGIKSYCLSYTLWSSFNRETSVFYMLRVQMLKMNPFAQSATMCSLIPGHGLEKSLGSLKLFPNLPVQNASGGRALAHGCQGATRVAHIIQQDAWVSMLPLLLLSAFCQCKPLKATGCGSRSWDPASHMETSIWVLDPGSTLTVVADKRSICVSVFSYVFLL